MKWKLLSCCFLLLVTCSCGAKFYAEETSVELYRPDGSMFGKVFSNKGYDQFKCMVTVKENGEQSFEWSAEKINSDTVAKEVVASQSKVIDKLSGTLDKVFDITNPIK